jgi:hypothetical protein
LDKVVNIVIFSKNRAAQLEALLRSFYENCEDDLSQHKISVIFAFDGDMWQGYRKLQFSLKNKKNIKWIPQQATDNFGILLLSCLDHQQEMTMFLVDDILFKKKFSFEKDGVFKALKTSNKVLTASLRLYPGINFCYPTHQLHPVPNYSTVYFENQEVGLVDWTQNTTNDWGYPMSLDGNVFRTNDIYPLLSTLNYKNPNSLEGFLASFAMQCFGNEKPLVAFYKDNSVLVNIPANMVQEEVKTNRFVLTLPIDVCQEKFMNGEVIDIAPLQNILNHSPHIDYNLQFKKQ